MTNTVTLLADHKGYTKPRVNGDEYMVDATILISAYTATGEVITAASLGLKTLTAVVLTGTPPALPQHSFTVQTSEAGTYAVGLDTSFTLEINVEHDTTGVSAELANGNTDFSGQHIRVRAFGTL